MKTIGLFGGSFDPVHNGHIKLAETVLHNSDIDEIWFVLANDQPLKDAHHATFEQRLNMLNLAINDERMRVCTIEQQLPTPSYTFNTVNKIMTDNANFKFKWVLGVDSFNSLHKWYEYEKLINLINFIVVERGNEKITSALECDYELIHFDDEASSSLIRDGHFNYLDPKVRSYIFDNNLYLSSIVYNVLSKKRADHVMRCVDVAIEIAQHHNIPYNDVYTATILHDITKELDVEVEKMIMNEHYYDQMHYHHKVYHQFTGAHVAKNQFLINNDNIIEAIKYHTTGEGNSDLSKLVFIADKAERGRPYDTEHYIEMSKDDLNAAFELVKADSIKAVKRKGENIGK